MDWSFGKRFLNILCDQDASLTPQVIGNEERCKVEFIDVHSCQSMWSPVAQIRANGSLMEFREDFFWKRKKTTKSLGYIVHTDRVGPRNELKLGRITIKLQPNRKLDWYNFMRELCSHVQPTYGMMHLFTEPELTPDQVNNDFQIGVASKRLERGIPELACINFLGAKLAGSVNRVKIESSVGTVEAVGEGHLVSVSDNLFSVEDDYVGFSKKRRKLKSIFDEGVFLMK